MNDSDVWKLFHLSTHANLQQYLLTVNILYTLEDNTIKQDPIELPAGSSGWLGFVFQDGGSVLNF